MQLCSTIYDFNQHTEHPRHGRNSDPCPDDHDEGFRIFCFSLAHVPLLESFLKGVGSGPRTPTHAWRAWRGVTKRYRQRTERTFLHRGELTERRISDSFFVALIEAFLEYSFEGERDDALAPLLRFDVLTRSRHARATGGGVFESGDRRHRNPVTRD